MCMCREGCSENASEDVSCPMRIVVSSFCVAVHYTNVLQGEHLFLLTDSLAPEATTLLSYK